MPDKAGETTAIPILLERLGEGDGLKGALVSIDAIATNPAIAGAILAQGADYLLRSRPTSPPCAARSRTPSRRAKGSTR